MKELAYYGSIMEVGNRPWAVQMLSPKRLQTQYSRKREGQHFTRTEWQNAPVMPTIPFQQSDHAPNEPLDLGVHQLIDRREWCKYPGFQEAINNERDGLVENETWSYDRICSKDDSIKSKKKYHLGRLMTILSLKHAESPTLCKLKARVVFGGDQMSTMTKTLRCCRS